jgi:hypothetical protein
MVAGKLFLIIPCHLKRMMNRTILYLMKMTSHLIVAIDHPLEIIMKVRVK